MIRIAVTGPESCGKTSLSEALALYYEVDFVPEFAREFLLQRDGKYSYEDLDIIAKGQLKAVEQQQQQEQEILIADTDMLVMYVWSQVVFGKVSPLITQALAEEQFDLYILCDTDIPWEYDPLRENEHDRDLLFEQYHQKLIDLKRNFIVVKGSAEQRLKEAVKMIDQLKNGNPR